MSGTIKHGCLVAAGIAIAALAAGNAHAGKPMNVLQKKAAADAMAREYQAQQAAKGFAAKSAPATIVAQGWPVASSAASSSVGSFSNSSRCWSGMWSRSSMGPAAAMRSRTPTRACKACSPA